MTDELTRIINAAPSTRVPERRPPKSYMRVGLSATLLVVYTGIVLAVTMWPTPVDAGYEGAIARLLAAMHRVGVPEWFAYNELEFTANIAMFVPLGFLVGLALPRRAVWLAFVLVPAFSAAIEWTQGNFLETRVSTFQDVIANTAGGWVGVLIAFVIRAMVHSRDQKVIARAAWDAKRGGRGR